MKLLATVIDCFNFLKKDWSGPVQACISCLHLSYENYKRSNSDFIRQVKQFANYPFGFKMVRKLGPEGATIVSFIQHDAVWGV